MCLSTPKIPTPPPPAQIQAMQAPKDLTKPDNSKANLLRRRGLWASIFTGPQGIVAAPSVTGSSSGITGG